MDSYNIQCFILLIFWSVIRDGNTETRGNEVTDINVSNQTELEFLNQELKETFEKRLAIDKLIKESEDV